MKLREENGPLSVHAKAGIYVVLLAVSSMSTASNTT